MDKLWQDLKFGLRAMLKSPGFTIVAVLTLALGIGANTAIFSVVNATMIRPLPYADSGRLMRIFHAYPKLNMPTGVTVSPVYFDYYRNNAKSFESVAALTPFKAPQNLTGNGEAQRVRTVTASWNMFDILGARPMLGRTFVAQEDQPGNNRVAVLSYGLWQRNFGGDKNVLGKPITLNGADYTVIGVMPKTFEYPNEAELWVPIAFEPKELASGVEYLDVIGKLRQGVTEQQANAELAKIAQDLIKRDNDGQNDAGWFVYTTPMREAAVGEMRTSVLVLLAAVGCVLLIACANVANLLLARASARQKEIAIRGALGASRWRMFQQLVTEGVLLSVIGGVFGLAFGYWGLKLLLGTLPMMIPGFIAIRVDATVMLFTFALAIVTGVLFSVAPALQMSKYGLNEALKEGGRSSSSGRHTLRSALIVVELAVSLVLLIGAGLLIKSFIRIQNSNPGFDPQNVLTMNVTLPDGKYVGERQTFFFSQVLDRISALPSVTSAAVSMSLPLQGGMTSSFNIEGKQFRVQPHAHVSTISERYFDTLKIPVINGRTFANTDLKNSQQVAIIDTKAAKAYFPGENPIGKRLKFGFEGQEEKKEVWREIVGVVGSVKHNSPVQDETKGQVFIPYTQFQTPFMNVLLRSATDPKPLTAAVRREIQQVDVAQPVQRVKTMEEAMDDFVSQPRFNMLLLASFAALALVLSAIGIYGVMAYSVTQRTHEIGVRMALGAQRSDVLKMVLAQALRLAAIGLVIGLVGSFLATRVLSTLLFGVKTTDPATFIGISCLLAFIAMVASYIPALRATRVDPNIALRYE